MVMALRPGLSSTRPSRTGHVVQAAPQGVAKRAFAPTLAPSKHYTITEVVGSEERNLLAQQPSPASPHAQEPGQGQPLLSPLTSLPDSVRDLFLPPGFPASVTPDYLSYQLWSVPTHVTGHLSHALVTSSLLAAVGFSASPATTVALSASIKWIVKDGVGALGRLIVGSRFSAEFDEDPRRWRMTAELLSTIGMGLEVATSLHPQYFLLLASAGKFCQALGKGMGKPVFRVIQTHFARAQNVGAVAAKEEVWEVVAQMAGLAASVAVLKALEGTGSPDVVVPTWAAIQAVHVSLRYRALSTLLFPSLSLKRTAQLATASVRGRQLPSVAEANAREPLLADPWDVQPRVRLGCGAAEAFGGVLPPPEVLQSYVEVYAGEGYVLVWREGTAHVMLKEGHTQRDLVRAVWQAAWLDCRTGREGGGMAAAAGAPSGAHSGTAGSAEERVMEAGAVSQKGLEAVPVDLGTEEKAGSRGGPAAGDAEEGLRLAGTSLEALEAGFAGFISECDQAGWEVGVVHMKVGRSRLRVGSTGPRAGVGAEAQVECAPQPC